jgi:multicomponent Na+:H+ antiporter subunit E
VAGVDVARRALDPRLPLRPGFTTVPVGIPPGLVRSAFVAITCLLPGTVAVGEDTGRILYHCLDTDQPVATQVADEEAALRRVLGGSPP